MKNLAFIAITIIIILITLLSGCHNDKSQQECAVPNCERFCENMYDLYCLQHTCQKEGCFEKKWEEDEFCINHKDYNNPKSKTMPSATQNSIVEARDVVNDYCNALISKHSYIKEINMTEEYDITNLYIVFHCNVIQKDNNVKPASIYVRLRQDGSFKVDELIYD